MTVFLLYAWTTLLLALLVARPGFWRRGAAGAAALGLGTALAAVALVPAAALARHAVRQTRELSLAAMYPWGIPAPETLLAAVAASRPIPLALAALALAPLALLDAGRRRVALWAAGLAVVATALALSLLTPLFALYQLVPGLAWFRGPNRLLFLAHFGIAVLAAIGLDRALRRGRHRAVGVVLGAAALELALVPGAPPAVPNAEARAWPPALEAAYRALAAELGPDRVWTIGDRSPAVLPPKLPSVAGVRALGDYEPGALRRQAEHLSYFAQGALVLDSPVPFEGRVFSLEPPPGREPPARRRRLLDLAAVRVVLVPAAAFAQPETAAFVRDAGLVEETVLTPGVRRFANPRALPRAFVTYQADAAPPPEALLPRLADERFDPLVASFVEGDPLPRAAGAPPRGTPAEVVRDEPHLVEVDATLAAPGLVVLADTFHPDWVASVDGVPAPIVATNHLFRGVRAPAGRHRIRFEHRPLPLWAGAGVSALALVCLGALARPRFPA